MQNQRFCIYIADGLPAGASVVEIDEIGKDVTVVGLSFIDTLHGLEQATQQQFHLRFWQGLSSLLKHGLQGHGEVLEVHVIDGATGAELTPLCINFDHIDEIGTIIVAGLEFIYKVNFSLGLKQKLVDRLYDILVAHFVVATLQLAEVVELDCAARTESLELTGKLCRFACTHTLLYLKIKQNYPRSTIRGPAKAKANDFVQMYNY